MYYSKIIERLIGNETDKSVQTFLLYRIVDLDLDLHMVITYASDCSNPVITSVKLFSYNE